MAGKTLILGLGNTILGDDGVGILIAREIKAITLPDPSVEVIEASLGGLILLDLITGYNRVIVVDAIMTEPSRPAGFIYRLNLDDLGETVNPYASHALDLKSTVELGRGFGYTMPDSVSIYAVEVKENTIFRESLTAEVQKVVPALAREIASAAGLKPAAGY